MSKATSYLHRRWRASVVCVGGIVIASTAHPLPVWACAAIGALCGLLIPDSRPDAKESPVKYFADNAKPACVVKIVGLSATEARSLVDRWIAKRQ
jgi:hypothetical protein